MTVLNLPKALRAGIAAAAGAAYPRECCGLIEGAWDGGTVHALALHPMRNIAPDADRFAIDPSGHIALQRRLRGTGRAIVGCYHSHPDGRAEPGAEDGGVDFLWLIAAVDAARRCEIAAHIRKADAWERVAPAPDSPAFPHAPASLDPPPPATL